MRIRARACIHIGCAVALTGCVDHPVATNRGEVEMIGCRTIPDCTTTSPFLADDVLASAIRAMSDHGFAVRSRDRDGAILVARTRSQACPRSDARDGLYGVLIELKVRRCPEGRFGGYEAFIRPDDPKDLQGWPRDDSPCNPSQIAANELARAMNPFQPSLPSPPPDEPGAGG